MPTAPFKVKAVYEYNSGEEDDLNFANGQIITVLEEEDDEWYSGEYLDVSGQMQQGIFPKNFVEKYEPEVPSRPNRSARAKKDVEPVISADAASVLVAPSESSKDDISPYQQASDQGIRAPRENSPDAPDQRVASGAVPSTQASPGPRASGTRLPPPPAAEIPNVGSFKDRIAAFNAPAATPITPFNPGGQSATSLTGFIKKPFVAPPPSKNAYLPLLREAPQKAYRREEDPNFATDHADDSKDGNSQQIDAGGEASETQAKPTSLKDRIALLQKQQLEQAARTAEGIQKKEKPRRPPKKRMESEENIGVTGAHDQRDLARVETSETVGKGSLDIAEDEIGPLRGQPRRQTSTYAPLATPPQPLRELVSDTNDADDSGAGDTEEAQEMSTEDDKPKLGLASPQSRPEQHSQTHGQSIQVDADEDEGDEAGEDEEEVDPEIKRRMEIRERIAKMSGGMGMMGMFGGPGVAAMPVGGKKRVPTGSERQETSAHDREADMSAPPSIPVMGIPGISPMNRIERGPETGYGVQDDVTPSRMTPKAVVPSDGDDDFIASPKRTSTDRSVPVGPQGQFLYPLQCPDAG